MPSETAAQRVWEAALGRLQIQVPRPSFDTWLRGTAGASLTDQTLYVSVRSSFAAEWLEQRMLGLIEAATSAVARRPLKVTFHVGGGPGEPRLPGAPGRLLSELAEAPLPAAGVPSRAASHDGAPALNPGYTFDSFVVGPSNQLAYAAAMAVADAPGTTYNPLFLYGPVGVGKTHLLHAVGLRAQARGLAVLYVTAEQFTNEFLAAIRFHKTDAFRERYRSADLLLVDDVQFLGGKESTQEGFFHTFNALHMAGRQLVLAADQPPTALPLVDERLRSRMESGLATDVGLPGYETRIAILERLAVYSPVAVDHRTVEMVASQAAGNVRQLVGYFNRITALAHFTNSEDTPAIAKALLPEPVLPAAGRTALTADAVLAAVAAHCNVPADAITGKRRDRAVSAARQIAMLLLHDLLHLSPTQIGLAVGNRHRATVMHGLREVSARQAQDPALQSTVQQLRQALQPSLSTSPTPLLNAVP